MTSETPIWKRFTYYWLSPLLLVSLGLHGLGLLIPVPDPISEEIEEPEVELPEPIQVTELPLTPELEPEPIPEQIFIPAPPPAVVEPPPVVIPPPVIQSPPVVEPLPPEPEPILDPEPVPEPIPAPDPVPDPIPDPSGQKPVKTPGTLQNFTPGSPNSRNSRTTELAIKYGDFAKEIETPLLLTYLADGKCYEEGPQLSVPVIVAIDAQGSVAIDDDPNNPSGNALFITQTSGYSDIDEWIEEESVFGLPDEAFSTLPNLESGDIAAWINEVRPNKLDEPIVPAGETAKTYAFTVVVTIEGSECEGAAP